MPGLVRLCSTTTAIIILLVYTTTIYSLLLRHYYYYYCCCCYYYYCGTRDLLVLVVLRIEYNNKWPIINGAHNALY